MFYVAISVMNLLLVSVFWSFILEILFQRADQAPGGFHRRRRHPGALVGPGATALFVKSIGISGVLYVGAAHVSGGHRPAARADGAMAPHDAGC